MNQCWWIVNFTDEWAKSLRAKGFKKGRIVKYHIFSFIWTQSKMFFYELRKQTAWLVGNGENINFWLDNCRGKKICDLMQIPTALHCDLKEKLKEVIQGNIIIMPHTLTLNFLVLHQLTKQVVINPLRDDIRFGAHQVMVNLLSEMPMFISLVLTGLLHGGKGIWSPFSPPSKSFLFWRLIHEKLPMDDKLYMRWLHLPSMCSLCLNFEEAFPHLFFNL